MSNPLRAPASIAVEEALVVEVIAPSRRRVWKPVLVSAVLGAVLLASCSTSVDAKKAPPPNAEVPAPLALRKPSCNAGTGGVLDAPLRFEKWATSIDVAALKATATKMNTRVERFDSQMRGTLLKQRDAVTLAELDLATASEHIATACNELELGYLTFQERVAPLRSNSDDLSRAVVQSGDALMDLIECWSYDTDPSSQLEHVGHEISALAELDTSANAALRQAIHNLALRHFDFSRARVEQHIKHLEYVEASRQMGRHLSEAARVAGLGKTERALLSETFAVLPKINDLVQQLDEIAFESTTTRERRPLSSMDVMCRATPLFEMPVRTSERTSVETPGELHELWQQRLGAVHEVVDQVLAIPGVDW